MSPHDRASIRVTVAAVLFFAACAALAGWRSSLATGGHLSYALDDAYIHMAIAKNMAMHGVWGTNPTSFASASSSPLWTAVLAVVFWITGVHDSVPLLLNLVAASASVAFVALRLRHAGCSVAFTLAALVAFIALVPMVLLVWIGMEHSLHVLLTLATVSACVEALEAKPSNKRLLGLAFICAALVGVRYEGLFVVASGVAVSLRRQRWDVAVTIGAGAAMPVVLVGIWNLAQGWFFFPASVVMKRTTLQRPPEINGWSSAVWDNVVSSAVPPEFVAMVALGSILFLVQRNYPSRAALNGVAMFLVSSLLHLSFARFGWFFRYEAYLMALGLMTLSILVWPMFLEHRKRTPLGISRSELGLIMAIACVWILALRAAIATYALPMATKNIYEQQRQMGRFVSRYYDRAPVVLNDIGAVSYYTDAAVLDLMGLSSLEVARLRVANSLSAAAIQDLAASKGATIAIIYEKWFPGDLAFYRAWIPIATWSIRDNVACGDVTVSFFASEPGAGALLRANLERFAPDLPSGVTVAFAAPVTPGR